MRSFLWLSPLLALLALAGCAATQNTLAQDLAWDRWRSCDRFATVKLQRIEPDGRVWVEYAGPGEVALWSACMREAAAKQGSQIGIAAPMATLASSSPVPQFPANVPGWRPGFEWAYRFEAPTGSGTYVWTVDRQDRIDNTSYWVVKTGTREIFYRVQDLASGLETVDGIVIIKHEPPRLNFTWPLNPGMSWEQNYREERPKDRQTNDYQRTWTVESEETVTVPAGAFKAVKITQRVKQTGSLVNELWYSPETMNWVKLREVLTTGIRNRELIAYKIR